MAHHGPARPRSRAAACPPPCSYGGGANRRAPLPTVARPASVPLPPQPSRELSQQDAAVLKSMVSSQFQFQRRQPSKPARTNPVSEFMQKLHVAWKIFFPDAPKVGSGAAGGRPRAHDAGQGSCASPRTPAAKPCPAHRHYSRPPHTHLCTPAAAQHTPPPVLLLPSLPHARAHARAPTRAVPVPQGRGQEAPAHGAGGGPVRHEPAVAVGDEEDDREGAAGAGRARARRAWPARGEGRRLRAGPAP